LICVKVVPGARIEGLCEPGRVGFSREGTVDLRKTDAPIDGHRILTCQRETLGGSPIHRMVCPALN
jgi:hypothetical protein